MSEPTSDIVSLEFSVGADPATAWSYWTTPERLTRWMGRTATVDARPGGEIRVDYGNAIVMRGAFVDLDEPAGRLAFTWGWEDPAEVVRPGGSLVEVTFQPVGDGTVLRLRHSGLPEGERESHLEGWEHFRPRLIDAVAAETTSEG